MESAFFGTPAAALPVLRALAGASQLRQVWTRPPAKAGRGMARRPSPVQEAGEALGAAVFAPASGAEAEALANKGALRGVELAVVFAYGLRLPPAVLQAPRLGCINLHPSLLPRWRGAAPVQAAILAGERASGWSWIRMTERMDAGPVLAAGETPIGREETAGELEARLIAAGAAALPALLQALERGEGQERAQEEALATSAPKHSAAERRLDWREPAAVLARRVRAFAPHPGAWAELPGNARVKVLALCALEGAGGEGGAGAPRTPRPPGTLVPEAGEAGESAGGSANAAAALGPVIACGPEGREAVVLARLQKEGGKEMEGAAFLRGFAWPERLPLPSLSSPPPAPPAPSSRPG